MLMYPSDTQYNDNIYVNELRKEKSIVTISNITPPWMLNMLIVGRLSLIIMFNYFTFNDKPETSINQGLMNSKGAKTTISSIYGHSGL